jgi:putative sterol carrier protein
MHWKKSLMAQQIEVTPDLVFEQMPLYFIPGKARNTNATIAFVLTGDHPGRWYVRIADGKAEVGKGEVKNPKLTLQADSRDYVNIALGLLNPRAAFMSGKLKIKGDLGLAMKVNGMFKRPS